MKRQGITLTEVLVAIFVTGMGSMALMTLFPLGALNMSLAIKDDRSSQCAANAASLLRTVWRQGLDSDNPDPNLLMLANGSPVYLDPIGIITSGPQPVGGVIPRIGYSWQPPTTPLTPATRALTFQYFSLMDDIEFDFNGAPIALYPGSLPRNTLYSWAYMLRPPQPGNPATGGLPPRIVDYSIVVYNRRSVALGPNGQPLNGQIAETPIPGATLDPVMNIITLPVPANSIKVNKGSWVLDISTGQKPFLNIPHAYFYRVNSVVATNSGTVLKVDQQLRGFDYGPGTGTVVLMGNVVEVFEKSTVE